MERQYYCFLYRYDILNYQGQSNGYVLVGDWQGRLIQHLGEYNETLVMDDNRLIWYDGSSASNNTPVSLCSQPCAIGQFKVRPPLCPYLGLQYSLECQVQLGSMKKRAIFSKTYGSLSLKCSDRERKFFRQKMNDFVINQFKIVICIALLDYFRPLNVCSEIAAPRI